jgi:hypothetical protein
MPNHTLLTCIFVIHSIPLLVILNWLRLFRRKRYSTHIGATNISALYYLRRSTEFTTAVFRWFKIHHIDDSAFHHHGHKLKNVAVKLDSVHSTTCVRRCWINDSNWSRVLWLLFEATRAMVQGALLMMTMTMTMRGVVSAVPESS